MYRKYLQKAGIIHTTDDGKTMHGLRRAIGARMVAEKVPVTTVVSTQSKVTVMKNVWDYIQEMLLYKESLGFSRKT